MKLLMENWRSYLKEDAKTLSMAERLPELGWKVKIAERKNGDTMITLVHRATEETLGVVKIYSSVGYGFGQCLKTHFVGWAMAEGKGAGFGPLLYDVAMELVSIDKDSSLTADRSTVSDEAFAVWKHYLTKRNDVEEFQLDDLNNTLTPELEDNCKQRAFDMRFGEDEPDVYGKPNDAARKKIKKKHMELSPITKVYKKTNRDVLDFLEENDVVIRE